MTCFSYRHTYRVAGRGEIRSAQLAPGAQGGYTDAANSNTDVRLRLDGVSIPRPLDNANRFSIHNSFWGQSAVPITIAVPDDVLHELTDGEFEVRIDNAQLVSGGLHSYAIACSELAIATEKRRDAGRQKQWSSENVAHDKGVPP